MHHVLVVNVRAVSRAERVLNLKHFLTVYCVFNSMCLCFMTLVCETDRMCKLV